MQAHIVSCSFTSGNPGPPGQPFTPISRAPPSDAQWRASYVAAMQPLATKGVLTVVAAGNDATNIDLLVNMGCEICSYSHLSLFHDSRLLSEILTLSSPPFHQIFTPLAVSLFPTSSAWEPQMGLDRAPPSSQTTAPTTSTLALLGCKSTRRTTQIPPLEPLHTTMLPSMGRAWQHPLFREWPQSP